MVNQIYSDGWSWTGCDEDFKFIRSGGDLRANLVQVPIGPMLNSDVSASTASGFK